MVNDCPSEVTSEELLLSKYFHTISTFSKVELKVTSSLTQKNRSPSISSIFKSQHSSFSNCTRTVFEALFSPLHCYVTTKT